MPEKEAIDLKVYACSNIHLGEVLFHYVMFCDKKKIGIFRAGYIAFPSVKTMVCCSQWYFLVPVGKRN